MNNLHNYYSMSTQRNEINVLACLVQEVYDRPWDEMQEQKQNIVAKFVPALSYVKRLWRDYELACLYHDEGTYEQLAREKNISTTTVRNAYLKFEKHLDEIQELSKVIDSKKVLSAYQP